MSELPKNIQIAASDLKATREELALKIHLAKADIRDDWEKLEKQWQRFSQQLKRAGHEAAEAGDDIGEVLEELGAEIKKGYDRVRKAL